MARAWRSKNLQNRRKGALERLESYTFSPKKMRDGKQRNEESWTKKKEAMIETLKKKVRV